MITVTLSPKTCKGFSCKCDHCGKRERFKGRGLILNYSIIKYIVKKAGWIVGGEKQWCSSKCEDAYQKECDHVVIRMNDYTKCIECGQIWQPDYDSMREGK